MLKCVYSLLFLHIAILYHYIFNNNNNNNNKAYIETLTPVKGIGKGKKRKMKII